MRNWRKEKKMTIATKTENGRPEDQTVLRTLEDYLKRVGDLCLRGVSLRPLAEALLRDKFTLERSLAELRTKQEELRREITNLTAPQYYPAVITGVSLEGSRSVEVFAAGLSLQVAVHPDVPSQALRVGARGLLSGNRNCLLEVHEIGSHWNEVGTFEGYVDHRRRILIRHQDQLCAVTQTEELALIELRRGELVGFNREGPRLAYVRVEPPAKENLFIEETPTDRFEELGGLDREIALLQRVLRFRLQHPELARRYRLPAKRGILLEGPPGNGKTKLARCLARFIADLVPAGQCRFMAIAGSSDYSMWLGQSEQRIIARFEAARELATQGELPVVMFFDEIDAIGRRRGADLGSTATDRILATFLAQLDGVQQISNLIVVAATNRADVLDNGLVRPGRLGDVRIRIPAPNRQAARAILMHYLEGDLPVKGEPATVVETLLSRLYSPRSEYAELVRVTLRDGRKLAVGGRDLVSGAMLENVVRMAADEAADREARTGRAGITEADLAASLDLELRSLAGLLNAANVRTYTTRLPPDVDPVGVELVTRGPDAAFYLRTA
jgi:proteasome-associated ATPase